MNINIKSALCSAVLLGSSFLSVSAQEGYTTEETNKRAWEIGIGASGFHMPRSGLKNVATIKDKGYLIDIMKRDILFGGHVYVARELSDHFALDLQGTFAYAKDPVRMEMKNHYAGMATLGLQWRLGKYFDSKYIDPFFRVGAGYMYKNFRINYMDILDGFNLSQENEANKYGNDYAHLIPITGGAGVNMWLNDSWGIGMQADYVHLPYKKVADSFQGTVRLLWRIGGNSKKTFVPVERIVEREVIREVEKLVPAPAPVPVSETIYKLFSTIYFEFDKATFTSETLATLDELAEVLKQNTSMRFCIIGCTDRRGSEAYNKRLSEDRARAVAEALIERGVPGQILKWRGVGKSIAYAPTSDSDDIRRGDRKIIVEVVTNNEYWNRLK